MEVLKSSRVYTYNSVTSKLTKDHNFVYFILIQFSLCFVNCNSNNNFIDFYIVSIKLTNLKIVSKELTH